MASIQCGARHASLGRKRIIFADCSNCDGSANLEDAACLESLVDTIEEFQGIESIVLRGTHLIKYSQDAVSQISHIAELRKKKSSGQESSTHAPSLLGKLNKHSVMSPSFCGAWIEVNKTTKKPDDISYYVNGARVRISSGNTAGKNRKIYELNPPESAYDARMCRLILNAREQMFCDVPENLDITDSRAIEKYVAHEGRRQICAQLESTSALTQGPGLSGDELSDELTETLVRYTAGLGIIEYLLCDNNIQDIFIDAPAPTTPVHLIMDSRVVPERSGKVSTNITLTEDEVKGIVSRLCYLSQKPFSERVPLLETNLEKFASRATVIGPPLCPDGISIAIRRHSREPWTLTRLIQTRSLTPMAAALLSLLVLSRSTILIAGSRGAGKSSLLGALCLEFPRDQRIVIIEDTAELPHHAMQEIGYKTQSLLVKSALGGGGTSADDALKISLRLGESAIVMGEVRGSEARTLYEAMRTGVAGSSVMGTIHGNSPQAVLSRVTGDLGISADSFAATDIIVIAGLVMPHGSTRLIRRVTNICELEKHNGNIEFHDLLRYNQTSDMLEETERLRHGSVKLGAIAQSWAMTYDEVIRLLNALQKVREALSLIDLAKTGNRHEMATMQSESIEKFYDILECAFENGKAGPDGAFCKWKEWYEKRFKSK